jgi:hypothetical protein
MTKWRPSGLTEDEKFNAGWPAVMAAAEEVASAKANGDVIAELMNLRDLQVLAGDITSEAIERAREYDVSWATIGRCLGLTPQAVWERFHTHQPQPRPDRAVSFWKMNLDESHRATCEKELKFGTDRLLDFSMGDVLLLQATRQTQVDADRRITSALVYDSWYEDLSGESVRLWGRAFRFILIASECVTTTPFSLDRVANLKGNYSKQGQMNHQRILLEDIPIVIKSAGLSPRLVA